MKGRHTSLDKHLKKNILWIEEVPGHIRFKMDVEGGIKVTGYSGTGVIDIFIKIAPISARNEVKTKIAERYKSKNQQC